jgi:hypothetical protein
LVLWTVAVLVALVVTALKGRWGWLIVGVLLGGVPLMISAFLTARPGSLWERLANRRGQSPA